MWVVSHSTINPSNQQSKFYKVLDSAQILIAISQSVSHRTRLDLTGVIWLALFSLSIRQCWFSNRTSHLVSTTRLVVPMLILKLEGKERQTTASSSSSDESIDARPQQQQRINSLGHCSRDRQIRSYSNEKSVFITFSFLPIKMRTNEVFQKKQQTVLFLLPSP